MIAPDEQLTRAGMDPARVARVAELFRAQQVRGVFPGGQLAVWRRGVFVLDDACGIARGYRASEGEEPVEFTPSTRMGLFSAGKPLAAIAIARLEELGLLAVEDHVAKYWPEFTGAGKSEITILDVLLHRSGLQLREIEQDWRSYGDWDGIMRRIERAAPRYPRGTLAYQPMGFGWILGELVRRVSGKPIDRYLDEDLFAPAGIEGLRLGAREEWLPTLARSYWLDAEKPKLAGHVLEDFEEAQNSKVQQTALLPGAGTIGTARALASVYAWLLDGARDRDGAPMISAERLARYTTKQTSGLDKTVGVPMILGRGFALGWKLPYLYGWWSTGRCYGHAGNFSTAAWADPTTGCAIAIATNGNRSPNKLIGRFAPLGTAIRRACVA
ncbi:beta-lactamase family protein [Myxococcota bacterium]|nr:beta-lactamase family protein [Myxococcota bacterium]